MLKIQKKRRSWALYFAGFLLFIQLFSVLIPAARVHATTIDPGGGTGTADTSPFGQLDTVTMAQDWALVRGAANCLNSVDTIQDGDTISESAANAGKWYNNETHSNHIGEYAAMIIEGASSDDDKSSCNDVLSAVFDKTGISAQTFLCTMGYGREVGVGGPCDQGGGDYKTPSSIKSGSDLEKAWSKALFSLWSGGKNYSQMLSSPMKYFIYFNDFRQACGKGNGGSTDTELGFKVEKWNNQLTTKQLDADKKAYHLPWYTRSGAIQDSYVLSLGWDETRDVGIDGWNTDGQVNYLDIDLKDNSNNDINNSLKCRSLANNMHILGDAATQALATDTANGKQIGGGTAGGSQSRSCFSEGGLLSWILCPLLTAIDATLDWLDQQINKLLFVDAKYYSTANIGDSWAAMRNIAYLILIPMMLVMVIGTAVGFGPFDAYTVKKALPRMLVAVIFISLSLPITQLAVVVSNDAGNGIGNFITSTVPKDKQVNSLRDIFKDYTATSSGGSDFGLGLAALVGLGAGFAVGLTLISFASVAAVGLLIGFTVLVMRQVLLVALIVVAPLAILAWVFPGNDKLWGIWKTTFIAMLMMYPLISILIATGKFVAGISG